MSVTASKAGVLALEYLGYRLELSSFIGNLLLSNIRSQLTGV